VKMNCEFLITAGMFIQGITHVTTFPEYTCLSFLSVGMCWDFL
jgi:hypothetical protein